MITYEDKEDTQVLSSIAEKNKVTASDMNQIKSTTNGILELLFGSNYSIWNSSSTYTSGTVVSYNYKLYENLTGTNTTTTPDKDTANWQEETILTN